MKRGRLRDRWVGLRAPHFERDCSPPEKWAVYVFEIPGVNRSTFHVVGRLLQRPWSRVGGGGEMADRSTPIDPQAREWLARNGLLPGQDVCFPMGSLIQPQHVSAKDLAPWSAYRGSDWAPEHTLESLGGAREKARCMSDVICPIDTQHRCWP